MSASVVRAMTSCDLPGVASVTNAAFGALGVPAGGAGPAGRACDPGAVLRRAVCGSARVLRRRAGAGPGPGGGALISVARGTLGWFGPLAVHPHAQRSGAGGKLVAACTTSWRRRGVRLMGLETLLLAIWSGRLGHLAVHAAQQPRAGRQGAPGLPRAASRSPPTSGSAGQRPPRGSAVGPLRSSRPSTAPAAAGFAWRLWPGRALSSRGRCVPVLGAAVTAAWGRACRRGAGNCGARRWWRPRWSSCRP